MSRTNPIPVERARTIYAVQRSWRKVRAILADEYGTAWNWEAIRRAALRGSSHNLSPWTDLATQQAKDLQARGYSAGNIALILNRTIGPKFSRNSVIGKLARLGLSPKSQKHPNGVTGGAVTKINRVRKPPFAGGYQALRNGPRKPPQFPKLSQKQRDFILGVPLEALSDHRCGCAECMSLGPRIDPQKCKWPLDDPEPGKEFCGARQMEGLPYCEAHAALAYTGGYQAAMRRQAAVIRDAVERLRRG